jgi:hypothetical protein
MWTILLIVVFAVLLIRGPAGTDSNEDTRHRR